MRESQQIAGTFQDKCLTCSECGKDFVWTAGEQEFFQRRKFHQPKRCQECRKEKKASA